MSNRTSRETVTTSNQQLEGALDTYYPKGSFVIDGKTYKTSDIVALLEKEDTLNAAAVTARAAWQTAASAARAQTTANDQMRIELKAALKSLLGRTNASKLQEFGFSVRARAVTTTPAKAQAAQKAKATREARGTLGSKQRLAITGAAEVPAATPSSTPAPVPNPAGNGAPQK
jgi:3-keto-L-gulonate-6-phosphate decarboxylase